MKVLEISDSATIALCVLTHTLVAVTVVGLSRRWMRGRDLLLTAVVMLFSSRLVGLHIVGLGMIESVRYCVVFGFGLVPLGEK